MGMIVRQMEACEAAEVYKIGKRAFTGLEGIFLGRPRQALVAILEGRIVGAILYKFFYTGTKKIGYIDYAFVDPAYHNQGIGGVLYQTTADFLWEQGCDALTAVVKDDNVGSWGLFLKNGFSRVSLSDMVGQFGFAGMLRQYFGTPLCVGIGMEYYVALRGQKCPSGKGGSTKQIAAYFLANLFFFLLMLLRAPKSTGAFFAAYLILLAGGMAVGYIGTLFSKRKWNYRLNNGGGLVCILANCFGSVFPMIGNWYPERYENTDGFRRDMGINGLMGWIFVLALSLFSVLEVSQTILSQYIGQIGALFLMYRVLAVYPFESFGGRRVYCWKRWLYVVMTVLSLAVFAAVFIL